MVYADLEEIPEGFTHFKIVMLPTRGNEYSTDPIAISELRLIKEVKERERIAKEFLQGEWKKSSVAQFSGIAAKADETLERMNNTTSEKES